ncbi:hypothetical protein [Phormidium tenue]|uniref:DUF1871 domain-containing protein n=1 Tax=Phormidium tenue NIES-30 TaxID=549789 RepID=A0A1U7J8Z1_9CYAN|nr:hypothetical protein [Phormidium tenue]MBD2231052.1 hypothetical protein [Phormidium tenue FACHB-1052]OKH49915.1 hypothetical protein NIES30_04170 [Phormidium tenue NIES-30]
MSSLDEELYRRTDEVLHYLWDPVGVAGIPGARDEYDAYIPQVFSLLKAGAGADEIADYLTEVATQSMGLGHNRERDRQIADLLLEWKAKIFET